MSTLNPSCPTQATRAVRPRVSQDAGLEGFQWFFAVVSWLMWIGVCVLAALFPAWVAAQPVAGDAGDDLRQMVRQSLEAQRPAAPVAGVATRVAFELGELNPRLKLAPCQEVKAYMPAGARMWGRTRVGLRCVQGPTKWNVFWPVTVRVFAPGLVPAVALRVGDTVRAEDVRVAEVDLAASQSPAVVSLDEIVGRTLARGVAEGESLRQADLKSRRWFAAGDTVKLRVQGDGFQAMSAGTALNHGEEGRCVRIRTEAGKVVCADPVGDRLAEVRL